MRICWTKSASDGQLDILTRRQNKNGGNIAMKKNIGSRLARYPMPITVVGAMNGGYLHD